MKKMEMKYELITPEIAAEMLENNPENRRLSQGTVKAYVSDMLAGNWDENTAQAIAIDENRIIRDGQHRLTAVVESGVSIHSWVCRNVSVDGIYDNNRKRSIADQITITASELDYVYRSSRYISVARTLVNRFEGRMVTPKEIIDFTNRNKELLDGYFLNMDQSTVGKISLAVVHMAMFLAYANGVQIEDLLSFYDVLKSGMSTTAEEFPIIAYRNYLQSAFGTPRATMQETGRCQYAIQKYLTKSCTRRSIAPKELIYPIPDSIT